MTGDTSYHSQSRCPLCGRWEQTQPVPAIVAAQTTVTTTHGSSLGFAHASGNVVPVVMGTRSTGFSSTPLATALRLQVPRLSTAMSKWGWFLTLFGIAWTAFIGYGASMDFGQHSNGIPLGARVFVVILLGGWIPALGVALLIGARAQRRRFRERAPLEAMAAHVWSYARYCHGDHIVYLPDGAYTDPAGINALVYAAAQRALVEGTA
jgi:hypothetical protein